MGHPFHGADRQHGHPLRVEIDIPADLAAGIAPGLLVQLIELVLLYGAGVPDRSQLFSGSPESSVIWYCVSNAVLEAAQGKGNPSIPLEMG